MGLGRRRSPSTATGPPVPSSARRTIVDEDSGHRTDRVMTITYHDRYEQTPAGWRLTHRRLDIHRMTRSRPMGSGVGDASPLVVTDHFGDHKPKETR